MFNINKYLFFKIHFIFIYFNNIYIKAASIDQSKNWKNSLIRRVFVHKNLKDVNKNPVNKRLVETNFSLFHDDYKNDDDYKTKLDHESLKYLCLYLCNNNEQKIKNCFQNCLN